MGVLTPKNHKRVVDYGTNKRVTHKKKNQPNLYPVKKITNFNFEKKKKNSQNFVRTNLNILIL